MSQPEKQNLTSIDENILLVARLLYATDNVNIDMSYTLIPLIFLLGNFKNKMLLKLQKQNFRSYSPAFHRPSGEPGNTLNSSQGSRESGLL